MGSAKALGEDLLQRLESFRGGLRNDDETPLVLQRVEESRLVVLGEVASSYAFGRLRRSLKRGVSRKNKLPQSSRVGKLFNTSMALGRLRTGSSLRILPSRKTSTRFANCAMSCS